MNIAFIPVRGGSKSIPKKNIRPLNGKPLVYWCLKALEETKEIHRVYVATDCNEIKSTVKALELPKVRIYDRDPENATDTASTESVMLEFLSKNNFDSQDKFILVQATSPLVRSKDFGRALNLMKSSQSDSLVTCVRIKRFFWNDNGKPINYDYMSRPRRQDFPGTLMENGAFYINTVGNIIQHKNRLSGKIAVYEMPEYTAVEIDNEEDWLLMDFLIKRGDQNR